MTSLSSTLHSFPSIPLFFPSLIHFSTPLLFPPTHPSFIPHLFPPPLPPSSCFIILFHPSPIFFLLSLGCLITKIMRRVIIILSLLSLNMLSLLFQCKKKRKCYASDFLSCFDSENLMRK